LFDKQILGFENIAQRSRSKHLASVRIDFYVDKNYKSRLLVEFRLSRTFGLAEYDTVSLTFGVSCMNIYANGVMQFIANGSDAVLNTGTTERSFSKATFTPMIPSPGLPRESRSI
jgi:hypothetical protein